MGTVEVGYSNVTKTESRRDGVSDAAHAGRGLCMHPPWKRHG